MAPLRFVEVGLDDLIAAADAAAREAGERLVEPGDAWPLIVVAIDDRASQLTLTERDGSPQVMHRLASRLKTAMRHPAAVRLVQPVE